MSDITIVDGDTVTGGLDDGGNADVVIVSGDDTLTGNNAPVVVDESAVITAIAGMRTDLNAMRAEMLAERAETFNQINGVMSGLVDSMAELTRLFVEYVEHAKQNLPDPEITEKRKNRFLGRK